MKYLQEIARIVTRNKLGKIEILDENGLSNGSMYGKFYGALTKLNLVSDKDLAKHLYGTTPGDDRYRQLKSRFRRRLLANLFLMDMNESNFSDFKKADYNAYRNYAICRILMRNGGTRNFERIAKQTFALATQYDMTQVAVLLAQDLCDYYSFAGDGKQFEVFSKELTNLRRTLDAESQAVAIHQQAKLSYSAPRINRGDYEEMLRPMADRLIALSNEHSSYGIQLTSFEALWIILQLIGDHRTMLQVAQKAEDFFVARKGFREHIGMTIQAQMECYLNLRDFDNGASTAARATKMFKYESQNWLMMQELHIHLAFLTGKYQTAADIFAAVQGHPLFKSLPQLRQERWRLFEAYLHFFVKARNLGEAVKLRPFDPKRFSRTLPEFAKDKTGFNTAILILQIMWLYELRRFDDIIDRADGLRMYNYRYLQGGQGRRAFIFIKMLLAAQAVSFKYSSVIKATQKLYDQLKATQDSTVFEWEIIPYELLWEYILAKMKMT